MHIGVHIGLQAAVEKAQELDQWRDVEAFKLLQDPRAWLVRATPKSVTRSGGATGCLRLAAVASRADRWRRWHEGRCRRCGLRTAGAGACVRPGDITRRGQYETVHEALLTPHPTCRLLGGQDAIRGQLSYAAEQSSGWRVASSTSKVFVHWSARHKRVSTQRGHRRERSAHPAVPSVVRGSLVTRCCAQCQGAQRSARAP